MECELTTPHSRLRTARVAKGYHNAKLFAKQYGFVYTTYISHENGKLPISENAARKYATILNISPAWLLHGTINNKEEASGGDNNSTNKSLQRRALEPLILPKVQEALLKIAGCYDNRINYTNLIKQCYIITSEILSKTDDIVEIEAYINSIVTLNKDSYIKHFLNSHDK